LVTLLGLGINEHLECLCVQLKTWIPPVRGLRFADSAAWLFIEYQNAPTLLSLVRGRRQIRLNRCLSCLRPRAAYRHCDCGRTTRTWDLDDAARRKTILRLSEQAVRLSEHLSAMVRGDKKNSSELNRSEKLWTSLRK
jgi:hypothetical protein